MTLTIHLLWSPTPASCRIETANASLLGGSPAVAERMALSLETGNLAPGKNPGTVTIHAGDRSFTFLLRDIRSESPILIPAFGVAVTKGDDARSYQELHDAVFAAGRKTKLQQIAAEPEESFNAAARVSRNLICQAWLGLSRDIRIFEFGLREPMLYSDWIQPRFAGHGYFWEEPSHVPPRFGFVAGRGWNSADRVKRRLDNGALPIVRMERIDEDIRYDHVLFVTLEKHPLSAKTLRGTHFRVADGFCVCKELTESEQQQFEELRDAELNPDEQTVFCCRITAKNTADVPRHAFFKTIHPHATFGNPEPHDFDGESGFSSFKGDDRVFGVSVLDGEPMGQPEIAVLLQPGETATLEFFLPHSPVSRERAAALAGQNINRHLSACRRFWKARLQGAASFHLPEKRIHEMVQASLLHMDLVSYGIEPDRPVAPANGTYSPVISEMASAVIYYDTVGLHHLAERCIDYYLARVRDDGFLQTFLGYMLETGCLLWLIGEHYRYTRDAAWVARIRAGIEKSCGFIERHRRECLAAGGGGLLDGKVADPEDDEVIFMLNGYAYLGLSRAAECMAAVDEAKSTSLREIADAMKQDIRDAYLDKQARGPVVPLGDGTWCPTVAPWLSRNAPTALFTDDQCWWTHGAATLRDDLLGPMTLVSQEVLDADSREVDFLLNSQCELMRSRNTSFSQPYLARHQHAHLARDEPEAFLKAYYNPLAALADRETYTFWEHYYHESPHKIGDEVQFLLQTRWMLYMEDGETLHLLRGIPRAWLADGKRIEIDGAVSTFGPLSLRVVSRVGDGSIEAEVTCPVDRELRNLTVRLPHPDGRRAASVEGGDYDPDHERVTIHNFSGKATVRVRFSCR